MFRLRVLFFVNIRVLRNTANLLHEPPLTFSLWTVFIPQSSQQESESIHSYTLIYLEVGKAYANQLAKRGINIILVGRNEQKLKGVAEQLESQHNIQTKLIIADFVKGREIYKSIRQELNDINVGILVNNVGIQYKYPMSIAELPEDEIWDNVNVNITSATMMTSIVLPKMIERNQGAIVNLSSGAGYQPQPYMNLYAASKSYITSFSEGLRGELENTNITVQTLTPYYVSSKINDFAQSLQKVSFFIPDVDTYAESAVNSLGLINKTTGYWPHRLQYFFILIVPDWVRALVVKKNYKTMSENYKRRNNIK